VEQSQEKQIERVATRNTEEGAQVFAMILVSPVEHECKTAQGYQWRMEL
jgi:hypothetical protein